MPDLSNAAWWLVIALVVGHVIDLYLYYLAYKLLCKFFPRLGDFVKRITNRKSEKVRS